MDLLDQSVHTSGWVSAGVAARRLPILKLNCPVNCLALKRHQDFTGRNFLVAGHMLTAQVLYSSPLDVRGLILEVEQKPKFEAWIRNRDVDGIRLRLLLGLRHQGVLIDVKYTPNAIIPEILILAATGFAFGLLLHLNGPFDDSLGDADRNNLQLDYSSLYTANFLEVEGFRHSPLTDDQEPGARLSEAPAAAEVISPLHGWS